MHSPSPPKKFKRRFILIPLLIILTLLITINSMSSSISSIRTLPLLPEFLLPTWRACSHPEEKYDRKWEAEVVSASKKYKFGTHPLECRHSSSLETSPYLLEQFGPVKENWCELVTSPASSSSAKTAYTTKINYRSVFEESDDAKTINMGRTYFEYKGSLTGENWSHYNCPVRHRIRCPPTRKTMNKKHDNNDGDTDDDGETQKDFVSPPTKTPARALVIYIVSATSNAYQRHEETSNFNFFLNHGLIPANTPTALFDSVDYIFAKIQINNEETDDQSLDCGTLQEASSFDDGQQHHQDGSSSSNSNNNNNNNNNNVRFILAPKGPCDLCAYSRILDHVGILDLDRERPIVDECRKRGENDVIKCLFEDQNYDSLRNRNRNNNNKNNANSNKEYSHVMFVNNGVRGPFFNIADDDDDDEGGHPQTTWIDFAAMAGRRKIPNPRYGFFQHHFNNNNNNNKNYPQKQSSSSSSSSASLRRDCPIHVMGGTSINWEFYVHVQSFFLSVPMELLRQRLFPLFAVTCPKEDLEMKSKFRRMSPEALHRFQRDIKWQCTCTGELTTSTAVLDDHHEKADTSTTKNAIYSFSQQIYVQDTSRDSFIKKSRYYKDINPTTTWVDPCKGIFVKTGGDVLLEKKLSNRTLNAVDFLSKGMNGEMTMSKKKKVQRSALWDFEKINAMFKRRGCDWFM